MTDQKVIKHERNYILQVKDKETRPKKSTTSIIGEPLGLTTDNWQLIFGNWKPFENDEKCFSFHLKSYFHSQDI